MRALLDDAALGDDENFVGVADGREAVRDDDGGAPFRETFQGLLDAAFSLAIKRRCRFVEQHDRRITEQRARDRDALTLAARQADAQLADGWSATGSLGLMDSSLGAFTLNNTAQTPAGGRELANVPSTTYSIGTRYEAKNGLWASAELSGRAAYFESNTHDEKRSAFNVVNASLGYRHDAWSVTLWARNLLDERYEHRIFYFANAGPNWEVTRYESPAAPRQLGATVRYSF